MSSTPAPTPEQGKSRSWILIVVIVLVVCCLVAACLGLGYYVWTNGDQLFGVSAALSRLAAG